MGGDGGGGPPGTCWCNGEDVILALNQVFGEPANVPGSIFADQDLLEIVILEFTRAVNLKGACTGKTLLTTYASIEALTDLTQGNWGTYLVGLTNAQALAIAQARL